MKLLHLDRLRDRPLEDDAPCCEIADCEAKAVWWGRLYAEADNLDGPKTDWTFICGDCAEAWMQHELTHFLDRCERYDPDGQRIW